MAGFASTRSGRDWRVDTLRGYALVIMTVNHLPDYPFRSVAAYLFGYASAPDAFVFLSGLVSGWVYLKIFDRGGKSALEKRALRRARDIYLVQVALLAFSIAVAVGTGRPAFDSTHPLQALFAGNLLIYQPTFSDILPMYCLFLLFLPLILTQLVKGRIRLVMAVSAALWALSQFGIGAASSLVPWINLGHFNLLAWQIYFVAGTCIAFKTSRARDVVPKSRALLLLCAIGAALLFLDRHLHPIAGLSPLLKFKPMPNSNPARFIDAICLGYLIWAIPRAVDDRLKTLRIFRFLNFLGQHSLQVYAFSLFLTFMAFGMSARWLALPRWATLFIVLPIVASLAIPAQLHAYLRQSRPRPICPVLPRPAASPAAVSD